MNKGFVYYLNEFEEKFLIYSFAFSVVLIFLQICFREVGHSLSWSEELARYLFIWQCWIAVSLAEREKVHIRITMIVNKFGKSAQRVIEIIVMTITAAANVYFIYWGVKLIFRLLAMGATSTALSIPMWIIYTAMPVGCLAYTLRLLVYMYQLLARKVEV